VLFSRADARKRGLKIRVIRDASQSHNKNDENPFLLAHGIEVREMEGKGRGIFHDKFAIFDVMRCIIDVTVDLESKLKLLTS